MGRCFTLELAKLGARCCFCDVNPEGIAAVEAEEPHLLAELLAFRRMSPAKNP